MAQPESSSTELITRVLSAHLRDPAQQPCPDNFDFAAAKLYRELLVGNFDAALRACFPLWIKSMGDTQYDYWRDSFIAEHACRSPLFRQIPDEFLAYLTTHQNALVAILPYALELAHFEWLELALGVAEADLIPHPTEAQGDPWRCEAVLNPVHALVQYQYPVQRLAHATWIDPPDLEPQTTSLLVYRDPQNTVQVIELDDLGLRILATLGAAPTSGQNILAQWQEDGLLVENANAVGESIRDFLQRMLQMGVLLGTL